MLVVAHPGSTLVGEDQVAAPDVAEPALEEQLQTGRQRYHGTCVACHQADGRGGSGIPPLARSDFLMADKERAIDVVLNGLSGPIVVNGRAFDGDMPSWRRDYSDEEIASILTFVRNSWGNHGERVLPEDVARIRLAEQ